MNRKEYKMSMSGIRPSEQTVERIMDMTKDKKANKGLTFKRIASAALVLAILVGGGFGTNAIVKNNKKNQQLGVLVAYADDELIEVGSSSKEYGIIKGLYFAPADDEKMCKKQHEKALKDYNEYSLSLEDLEKLDESYTTNGVGIWDIYDDNGNVTTKLFTSSAGLFAANKTDYSNVKSFTVENESKDGVLQFEYNKTAELYEAQKPEDIDNDNPYALFVNNRFTLTGDELRESQKDWGHFGYSLEWRATAELFGSYRCEPDIKASDIKDKITFTFEYTDGTTESASVNIGFDSYGHMQIS